VTGPRFPLIDAHNHLGRWLTDDWAVPDVDDLLGFMDAWGIEAVVNLDGRWGEELDANLDRYDRAHPGRFATFAQFDWSVLATAGFGSRLTEQVGRAVDAGAKGLKVWKDLGLHLRDDRGALLAPDDERLGAVWGAAADAGVPVLIHTGDPAAFFEPMDETNERIDELRAFPEWWVGDRARFPTFSELLGSFERMVAAQPATTFIGAHVAGAAEDLAWVGSMLASYPNLHVDVGARIAELGRRPDAARALMLDQPSRILFGTDEFPPAQEVYAIHVRFFESADEHFAYSLEDPPPQGRWSISGLELPHDALRAIYRDNARRLIPGLGP
jgi:predicted TIM-barrel fold metal-dependent hydrolase